MMHGAYENHHELVIYKSPAFTLSIWNKKSVPPTSYAPSTSNKPKAYNPAEIKDQRGKD